MKIIKIEPYESGARPALQEWAGEFPPEGFAFCPSEMEHVFYMTNPAGFVDIVVEGDFVVAMGINQEALDRYIAEHPEEPEPQPEPTADEILNALLGVM